MEEQEEFDDVAMMKDPFSWPHMALPVKKSFFEIGVLIGDGPRVYLVNMWAITKKSLTECEVKTYDSFEALHADGWAVD